MKEGFATPCRLLPLMAACVLAFLAAGAAMGQGATAPKPLPGLLARLTEKDVDEAIDRAIKFLWIRQKADGSWTEINQINYRLGNHPGGTTALAVLALVEAGESIGQARMQKAIDYLLKVKMINTYAISLRVMAVSRLQRATPADRFEQCLKTDIEWLMQNIEREGAWSYTGADRRGDNSCSQFALLAIWEAATNGRIEISSRAWDKIKRTWLDRQRRDGGWMYAAEGPPTLSSTGTMTAAGLASLFICLEESDLPRRNPCSGGVGTTERALERGLAWFNEKLDADFALDGYFAFGVVRVALASGQKYIGGHDWYRIGLGHLAVRRDARDRWAGPYGPDVQAAFYLLFLLRGRVPVVFNKLQHAGDWDVCARDTASLARWISRDFEIPMTWQVVEIDRDVRELMDAPILSVSGKKALEFTAAQQAKLKEFVLRGGMIFGDALCRSQVFGPSFKDLGTAMFAAEAAANAARPEKPFTWRKLPPEHPVFRSHYRLVRAPELWGLSDGVRELMILSESGLGEAWQQRREAQEKLAFQMGANVFFYASAREPLRTRLRPIFLGAPEPTERTLKVVVLTDSPAWVSQPYALEQVAHKMVDDARTTIAFTPLTVGAAPLALPKGLTLLWVAGRTWPKLTAADTATIVSFLQQGGMMFVTAEMGDEGFRKWMQAAAPRCRFELMATDQKMIAGDMRYSRPIDGVEYRKAALKGEGKRTPELYSVALAGQKLPSVIYSPFDVYVSLLGQGVWGLRGYSAASARQIAANVILYADWSADQPRPPFAAPEPPATQPATQPVAEPTPAPAAP